MSKESLCVLFAAMAAVSGHFGWTTLSHDTIGLVTAIFLAASFVAGAIEKKSKEQS